MRSLLSGATTAATRSADRHRDPAAKPGDNAPPPPDRPQPKSPVYLPRYAPRRPPGPRPSTANVGTHLPPPPMGLRSSVASAIHPLTHSSTALTAHYWRPSVATEGPVASSSGSEGGDMARPRPIELEASRSMFWRIERLSKAFRRSRGVLGNVIEKDAQYVQPWGTLSNSVRQRSHPLLSPSLFNKERGRRRQNVEVTTFDEEQLQHRRGNAAVPSTPNIETSNNFWVLQTEDVGETGQVWEAVPVDKGKGLAGVKQVEDRGTQHTAESVQPKQLVEGSTSHTMSNGAEGGEIVQPQPLVAEMEKCLEGGKASPMLYGEVQVVSVQSVGEKNNNMAGPIQHEPASQAVGESTRRYGESSGVQLERTLQ